MNKLAKRALSILVIFCVLAGIVAFDTLAQGQPIVKYHYYNLAEYILPDGYRTDIVDGILYAYVVENGEAAILNIQTQRSDMEKSPMVFPTELGGYPVTTIGGDQCEIFLYLSYTDSLYPEGYDEGTGYGYAEYDPNRNCISEYVIPEGYKYIEAHAMYSLGKVTFPKSLRIIDGSAFDMLYTYVDENNGKHTFLPECYYTNLLSLSHMLYAANLESIILPSRIEENSSQLLNLLRTGSVLYVPSNISVEKFSDALYYFEAAAGDSGEIWPRRDATCTIHCASDSEFLSVFEEYGDHPYATIITDVTPAEYIAFPSETVNVNVGEVMDLEAKTYPSDAIWTACDYTVSDPSIVKIDEYSGRITALKEGTVTVTATHCERGYVDTCTVNVTTKPEPGVNGIEPATDAPYVTYGNRDYKINVTGSPSKIQVVRDNGGTTTIDRRKATVTSNGDTETWIVNMRVEAGTHNIRAKYGKVWDDKLTPFTVKYDLPGAYSFDLTYENGIGNFNVVTDPEIIKIQFALDNGCTLTYSQTKSYIGEDGLRHWEILRKIPSDTIFTLRTKYGYTWIDTNFEVNTIV